ncbi:thioredoxin [Reticulomyxa filosa]|uniref:Thioredoxin n=1 Tax=Reticulomyxa filosa TaxID=46433 RepID=X6M2T7_RETFI|nr:thioredoxin [Reticulomyxa filosa]|eukprot:ETO08244.1 thioredoxin [Reticulomyxa filosa]
MALLGLQLLCLLLINFQLSLCDVVELKTESFEAETAQGKWFLEFYAPWCGHCKNFAPVYKEASDEMEGRVKFGTVDVTAEKDLAKKFDVNRFPTVKLCAKFLFLFVFLFLFGRRGEIKGTVTTSYIIDKKKGAMVWGLNLGGGLIQLRSRNAISIQWKTNKRGIGGICNENAKSIIARTDRKAVEDQLANHKYEMMFVYVNNNNLKDKELMTKEANPYRPYIVIFTISHQQLLQLSESFILHTLKLSLSQWNAIQTSPNSYLISVSPQKHGSHLISSDQSSLYGEFFATNQFAPVVRLDETNHRSLSEKSWYLGLAVVAFDDEHRQQSDKFLEELESIAISNPSWRTKQHVSFVSKQPNTERSDTELRFPLLIGMTNFTQFEEFLKETLSLQKSDLPICFVIVSCAFPLLFFLNNKKKKKTILKFILYDNKEDGYYKSKTISMEFIEQVFEKKLPVMYSFFVFIVDLR